MPMSLCPSLLPVCTALPLPMYNHQQPHTTPHPRCFSCRPPSKAAAMRRSKADSPSLGLSPCSPSQLLSPKTLPSKQRYCWSHLDLSCRNLEERDSACTQNKEFCGKAVQEEASDCLINISCAALKRAAEASPWPSTACFLPFQHYRTGCSITNCPPTH